MMRKKLKNEYDRGGALAVILLLPSLLFMSIIMLYPLVYSVYLSFYNYQITRPLEIAFDPMRNINRLLMDDIFRTSLWNTAVFTTFTVFIGIVLGMVFAIMIDQLPLKLHKMRGVVLMPWVIPGIVVGYLFMYIFDTNVGIANHLLYTLGIIESYLPWLMRGNLAMAAVIIANVWNQAPFYMLMFTAALKSIPDSMKEAAYVEGASRWQEFIHITLPSIKGVVVITSLLMVIRNFNNFPIIFTMTGGGPVHSTLTSVLYIYRVAFEHFNMGYASLLGVLWVIILLFFAIIYVRLLNKDF